MIKRLLATIMATAMVLTTPAATLQVEAAAKIRKAIVNAEKYLPQVAELVTKEAGVVSRIKAEMTAE